MRNIIKIKPSSSSWTGWMVVVVPSELCECCVLVVEQGIIVCVPCLELDRPVKPNVLRYTWRDAAPEAAEAEAARGSSRLFAFNLCSSGERERQREAGSNYAMNCNGLSSSPSILCLAWPCRVRGIKRRRWRGRQS